jgi:anti-anti-sigma regulatory factor
MLRITIERNSNTATLKLAGRLVGPWVEELDRTWNEVIVHTLSGSVLLDLSDVTFVAPEGRRQLTSMCEKGARFKTSGCFGKGLIEEIVRDCRGAL